MPFLNVWYQIAQRATFAETCHPQVKKQKYVNLVDSGQSNNLFRGNRNTSKF